MFALVCDRVIPKERQMTQLSPCGCHQIFAGMNTPRVFMGCADEVLAQRVQPGTKRSDIEAVTCRPKLAPERGALTFTLPLAVEKKPRQ